MPLVRKSVLGFLVLAIGVGTSLLITATPGAAATTTVAGTVNTGGGPLNRRSGTSTTAPILGKIATGTPVTIVCQLAGQYIRGQVRDTDQWNRLSDGQYISDAYVSHAAPVPTCPSRTPDPTTPPATTPPAGTPPAQSGPAAGTVSTGSGKLNLRTGTSTTATIVDRLENSSALTIVCQESGQQIPGWVRTTDQWDQLANGNYVSDGYVNRAATPPSCKDQPAVTPPADPSKNPDPALAPQSWVVPVPGVAGQGFRKPSNPFHDGVDIMQFRGTPIRAASGGKVITVECNTSGPSCDVDGSPSVGGCGWYVEILHANKVITRYCHMVKKPEVVEGQTVVTGQVIGYVGTSGNSSAPHLHFEVHVGSTDATRENAVDPVAYLRSVGAPLGGT